MNNIKMKEKLLNSIFLKHANKFKNDLYSNLKDKQKRVNIYSDFLDMLLSAQKEDKQFEEIIPNYDTFLASCIEGENIYPKISQMIIKCKRPLITTFTSVILTFLLVFGYLFSFGYIGVWTKGIDFISKSNSYEHTSYAIGDEIEFQFNVRAYWDSSQPLYDNGKSSITVAPRSESFATDEEGDTLYFLTWKIILKCNATVNRDFAQIVCGVDYSDIESESERNYAKFSYELGGITYTDLVNIRPYSDFNKSVEMQLLISSHKSFFSTDEDDKVKLEAMKNTERITIRLSSLRLNQWTKK